MSSSAKNPKYFSSKSLSKPQKLTIEVSEAPKEVRQEPTQKFEKNSPKGLKNFQSILTPGTPSKPSRIQPPTTRPRSAAETIKTKETPTSTPTSLTPKGESKDTHKNPMSYQFQPHPNSLATKGKSKSTKVLPRQTSKSVEVPESPKNDYDLSNVVTKVKRQSLPKQDTHEEQKNKSELLYREHLFQTFQAMKFVKTLSNPDPVQLRNKRVSLPKRPGWETKKTIVFDLDETLVHCTEDLNSADVILPVTFPTGDVINAGVNIRPFVRECLSEANKLFEVIVFTASHKCYADVVLDYIDPYRELIHHRLYRESCLMCEGIYVKDLRVFTNRRLQDLVIVDNAAYSFGFQIDNGIPIISWHDDKNDKELFNLIDYMNVLANSSDVREVNRQTFRLRTFYEDYIQEFVAKDASKTPSTPTSQTRRSPRQAKKP
ncbi:unnamed protein product [Blepharisma stoltei]|uniref:FCP1 homology domain-containing protein n=1 Tax=Blepharisma stoltei TaxID=1481888 RepID=A0AAU9KCS5_9CILI|nr:unnamed protein product [Blepharisma stoltei]